jgi:hypothetical protein
MTSLFPLERSGHGNSAGRPGATAERLMSGPFV